MDQYAIGLDFGTESARALLVDVADGKIVAGALAPYPDGVLDRALPGTDVALAPDWALQNAHDWLTALEAAITQVLHSAAIDPAAVAGIGIDFTACTVLPTTADGTPLHALAAYREQPHAWVKLWKHHAAQPQADRINALAQARGEPWLARYGGKISAEWLIPKALQMLDEDPDLYALAARIVEGADWVVWQLTGELARNACAAGYKGTWHRREGYPAPAFLGALHPALADLAETRLAGSVVAPGTRVGGLTEGWATRLGLAPGTPVAAPIIDAHAAVLGGGVRAPGTLFMIMGTSTCHLLLAERDLPVPGISGVVEDGILPGLFGYEAGQAGVGDIFAWFAASGVPAAYEAMAADRGLPIHDLLAEQAAHLRPGQSGLLALDWWNGCRTPLVDADLSGAIIGYGLHTTPEAIYRALIEATAFGTRLIVETFARAGLPVGRVRVSGGLTANPLLLQIYADVLRIPLEVCATPYASALGAAMLGAVAGGAHAGVPAAVAAMAPPLDRIVAPEPRHRAPYDALYAEYTRLVEYFGRAEDSPLKRVRAIQREVLEMKD